MSLKEPIPNFVKAMGHRAVGYILNLPEGAARQVLSQHYPLSGKKLETLKAYIQLCRQMRAVAVSQGDIEQSFFHRLPHVLQGGHHIFNVWRQQHGGRNMEISNQDPLVAMMSAIAAELYPLFLVKAGTKPHLFYRVSGYLSATINGLPIHKQLYRLILEDLSFERIFQSVGNEPHETFGQYVDSTGHSGVVSLSSLPAALLINSYDLMRVRGAMSPDIFVETVQEMLGIARSVADGEVAHIPLFVGFRNASLIDIDRLDTKWGTLRRYTPGIAEYVLQAPSLMAQRRDSGFMLESGFAYALNSGELLEDDDWPDEVAEAESDRVTTELNITLCMALSFIDSTGPLVAPEWLWHIDPFSLDGARKTVDTVAESEFPVEIKLSNLDEIENWSLMLEDTDSSGIRLAFARLFSAARQPDQIDGLVDAIIALKNIFGAGGNPKLLPEAVGRIISSNSEQAKELAVEMCEDWETLLGGDVLWGHDEIKDKTWRCIDLCLTCLHHLYLKHPEIVSDPERLFHLASKK